jgi:hypothetical protein
VTVFGFIAAKRAEHSVKTMCRVLGVSRSGYHALAKREPSARALEDERLTERILEIHRLNRRVYGSPRIHAELRLGDGIRVGRKRVERLMREARISGRTILLERLQAQRDQVAQLMRSAHEVTSVLSSVCRAGRSGGPDRSGDELAGRRARPRPGHRLRTHPHPARGRRRADHCHRCEQRADRRSARDHRRDCQVPCALDPCASCSVPTVARRSHATSG